MHAAQQDSLMGVEGVRGLDMLVIKRREKGGKTKAKYEGYRGGGRGHSWNRYITSYQDVISKSQTSAGSDPLRTWLSD